MVVVDVLVGVVVVVVVGVARYAYMCTCTRGGHADALILLKRHTRIHLNPGHIIFFCIILLYIVVL